MNKSSILLLLLIFTGKIVGQNRTLQPSEFTWEGASTGNRAIWKVDDSLNVYPNIDGVDVKIKIKDPLHLNTTTINPSEFNDYTKSNTFYGRGNLAFQVTSTKSGQEVCLEITFSKPVFLNRLDIFDIDMLQSSLQNASTYQDSLRFFATSQLGNVDLVLSTNDANPTYTIKKQTAIANFIAGFNGDISHTNTRGALTLSSEAPVQTLYICYSNGSQDDGISNSHAVKIPGFKFTEFLGTIEGQVLDEETKLPLAGSVVRLLDSEGNLVVNKEGWVMQVTTDATGRYVFSYLPMGQYTIVQINPAGYDSSSDVDGANDNTISALLDLIAPTSVGNDFFEILQRPLPVKLIDFEVDAFGNGMIIANWEVSDEVNCKLYQLSVSEDGLKFNDPITIPFDKQRAGQYSKDIDATSLNGKIYIQLAQQDYDGKWTVLGVHSIVLEGKGVDFQVFPNPANDRILVAESAISNSDTEFVLYDLNGKLVHYGIISNQSRQIDISQLIPKIYVLKLKKNNVEHSFKIIKN
jgi:hypothetical protein